MAPPPLVTRLLRIRLWLTERLRPGEALVTYLWAGAVGCLGGLSGPAFRGLTDRVQWFFTGSTLSIEDAAARLHWEVRFLVPAIGGLLAGLSLHFGMRLIGAVRAADYMEAVTIGDGVIRSRPTLIRILSSVFSIASGGSIGREGAMVQLSSMLASFVGRVATLPRARLRLMVACGAAAGIASAYNAPIGGALFVAEIVLGTIAMESFGPLIVASVMATVVSRALMGGAPLFMIPPFHLVSSLELLAYIVLGLVAGAGAPLFLQLLQWTARQFARWKAPIWVHLTVGGMIVGVISTRDPNVLGNGYGAVSTILSTDWPWTLLLSLLVLKIAATAATVGSGAVGGVFTPTLLVGAALGGLVGTAAHALFPNATAAPHAYALVGMGAFLAATTHAPLTAILILFDMTLSQEIILPLMLACVGAYTVAVALRRESIYAFARRPREDSDDDMPLERMRVRDLMKPDPVCVSHRARFPEIVQAFVKNRHHNLFVVGDAHEFRGVIPLHDLKPHLNDVELAQLAIAQDLMHEDVPTVTPDLTLQATLERFARHTGERLPVVDVSGGGRLVGTISKSDLLLTLAHAAGRNGTRPR